MIVAEIILGTDIVMVINSYDSAKEVIEAFAPYMEPAYVTLLEFLLVGKESVNFDDFIACYCKDDHNLLGETILSISRAKQEKNELQGWASLFHHYYD